MARYRNRSVFSQGPSSGIGGRLLQFIAIVLLIAVLGGVAWLGFGDYQPARETVERDISP